MIRSDLDDRIEENTWETNPYRIIQCSRVMNCLCAHDRVILIFISLVVKHRGQINTEITFEWVHKKFVKRVHMNYFISYTTHETISDDENCDPHTSLPFSAPFCLCSVNDVTIERWWRNNYPHKCDATKWQVISNSLYIDFIHGDIHGWSCKNNFCLDHTHRVHSTL